MIIKSFHLNFLLNDIIRNLWGNATVTIFGDSVFWGVKCYELRKFFTINFCKRGKKLYKFLFNENPLLLIRWVIIVAYTLKDF